MKTLTLTITDIDRIMSIQARLAKNSTISSDDKQYLAQILAQVPNTDTILTEKISLQETFDIKIWDQLDANLQHWVELLNIGPGWDYAPFCYLVIEEDKVMLSKNVIIITQFAPCMSRNLDTCKRGFELWFKDDGMALFWLPTLEDAEKYSDLYNFKGSWKEAYRLLLETWKRGWPMEEFPEELKPFLKK